VWGMKSTPYYPGHERENTKEKGILGCVSHYSGLDHLRIKCKMVPDRNKKKIESNHSLLSVLG